MSEVKRYWIPYGTLNTCGWHQDDNEVVLAGEHDAALNAQRLRADTAEAELARLRERHDTVKCQRNDAAKGLAAAEQRIAALEARYDFLSTTTPYRFKKMQEAASTDGGDVIYFHADRFDAQIDAALQSTIASLEERITQFKSEEPEWSAMQQQLGDENAQVRDRIAELESGRGEPVAFWYWPKDWPSDKAFTTNQQLPKDFYEVVPLFTAPPAPVAVVLPERKDEDNDSCGNDPLCWFPQGWNACLDATAALNGPAK